MKIETKFKNKKEREDFIAALIHGIYAISAVTFELHNGNYYHIHETDTDIINPLNSHEAVIILDDLKEALLDESNNM